MPEGLQKALGGALRAQDKLNADIAQALDFTPSLTIPTLTNGWVAFRDTAVPQVLSIPLGGLRLVFIQGAVISGTLNTPAFVLSLDDAPDQELGLAADSNGAFGELVIQTNGNVIPRSGSNVYFSVTCSFLVSA